MLATASAQVCVPLGHSSLIIIIIIINDRLRALKLFYQLD